MQTVTNQFGGFDNLELFRQMERDLKRFGFIDDSYGGDTCPKLSNNVFTLFVDYADLDRRELNCASQNVFGLFNRNQEGELNPIFSTNKAQDVIEHVEMWLKWASRDLNERAKVISWLFDYKLRCCLGHAKYNQVLKLNRAEQNPNVCHSHDFIDANEVMLEVFQDLDGHCDVNDDKQNAEWNAAWDLWRQESA
jgi:hypothetical protein